jgi:TRAP-type mannitol/chloroaromatic compound transport system substrate-binding protein
MTKKVLLILIGITLMLTMLVGLLPSCKAEPTAPTPGAPTTPTPTEPGPTPTKPAPVAQGQVWNWKGQSGIPAGNADYPMQMELCDNISVCSGGRLNIECLPAGSIVGTKELFDAIQTGAVECGFSGGCSFIGKDMRFAILCVPCGGMTWQEYIAWLFAPRIQGRELAQEIYGDFNMINFPTTVCFAEAEYISNKRIVEIEDYAGLTIRGLGWWNKCLPEWGASAVYMPGQDLYSALERGVIDAAEYDVPHKNWAYGLHEVCRYQGFPGIHQISREGTLAFNLDFWNELPEDIQHIVKMCCSETVVRCGAIHTVESAIALEHQIDYGVEMVYQSTACQTAQRDTSWQVMEQECDAYPNDSLRKLWDKNKEFMYIVRPYIKLQTPIYDTDYPPDMGPGTMPSGDQIPRDLSVDYLRGPKPE